MSSFSVFDSGGGRCGLAKLIPAERFMTFAVNHYYQQRHVSWTPVFFADENLRAGFHYYAVPRTVDPRPSCFGKLVEESRAEQGIA